MGKIKEKNTIESIPPLKDLKKKTIVDKAKTIVWTVLASEDDYQAQDEVEKLLDELVKDLNTQKLDRTFQGATKL